MDFAQTVLVIAAVAVVGVGLSSSVAPRGPQGRVRSMALATWSMD
jgi:hypothetical protein